jgi:hypothetical protein
MLRSNPSCQLSQLSRPAQMAKGDLTQMIVSLRKDPKSLSKDFAKFLPQEI